MSSRGCSQSVCSLMYFWALEFIEAHKITSLSVCEGGCLLSLMTGA